MPSKKRSLGEGLRNSLKSEQSSVDKRFDKAEQIFATKEAKEPREREKAKPAAKKPPTEKVIRENYTMPPSDHKLIAAIRAKCLKEEIAVNKSEVLRAGLHALSELPTPALLKVINALEKMQVGKRARAS